MRMSEKCWHRDPSACKCKENARIKELEASEAALRKRVESQSEQNKTNLELFIMASKQHKEEFDRAETLQRRVDDLKLELCENYLRKMILEWKAKAESAEKERDSFAEMGARESQEKFKVLDKLHAAEKRLASLTAPTGEKELDSALESVDRFGHLEYPIGSDRAALCFASVVLAAAVRSLRALLEEERRQKANVQEDFLSSVMREKDLRGKLDEAVKALEWIESRKG